MMKVRILRKDIEISLKTWMKKMIFKWKLCTFLYYFVSYVGKDFNQYLALSYS